MLVNFIRGPGADPDLSVITTSCSFSQSSFPRLKAKTQCTDFFSYIFDGTYFHHRLEDFSKWNIGFDLLDLTLNFAFKNKQVGVLFFIELNGQRDQKNLLALLEQIVCEDCLMYAKYELRIK